MDIRFDDLFREGNECQLMALTFPIEKDGRLVGEAKFEELCVFRFPGHVISVYILDPARRLLSAYIWIIGMNTLGLYLLMDWNVPRFVYLNTGISCVSAPNLPRGKKSTHSPRVGTYS